MECDLSFIGIESDFSNASQVDEHVILSDGEGGTPGISAILGQKAQIVCDTIFDLPSHEHRSRTNDEEGKEKRTVNKTSCSDATFTTVPGFGASKSLHLGIAEVVCTIDACLDNSGPRFLSIWHCWLHVELAGLVGRTTADTRDGRKGMMYNDNGDNGHMSACSAGTWKLIRSRKRM